MDIEKKLNEINSRQDFVSFVELLISDLSSDPNQWVNKTLLEYLEGIANWTEDMEGYYGNNNLPTPEVANWKLFATILVAATIYE